MAEDRERFRALLDRIGQPYAPSWIVEGDDRGRRARRPPTRRSARSACRRSSAPRSRSAAPAAGSSRRRPAYRERVRAGLRASPIGQVMVERCLVGWGEIEYEVMRDADDTCIAVCSMENVDPLGVHTGDSIVVAPVQTLPDPVHQRLRSASLAIIRALGVEGGCNVQFALSPDYEDYAVIEVNPRVSRSSALASKATGYPIARVAAQIAAGRRLAEIPNVVTGTTVAAFEPALDYVVVKLPRFPFDKFPTADRSLGSQMKATGEVMAIDRTFGSALNKALRGLEQAGVGPLAEDPAWAAEPRLPRRGVRSGGGDGRGDDGADDVDRRRRRGRRRAPIALARRRRECLRVDPARRAGGRADRPAPLPRPVGHPPVAGPRPPPPRRSRGDASRRRPGSTRGSWPSSVGRSRLERDVADLGARLADPTDARRLRRCSRRPSGPASATASWRPWPAWRRTTLRAARMALGLRPGYAMVDTCAAEFAAETPYFYATYAAAGSPPEAPPVAAPGGPGDRLGARPDRAGDRVRLLRGPGRGVAPPAGLVGGDGQLEPGDRVDRLRREQPALLRAARPRIGPAASSRPRPGPASRSCRRSSSSAARPRSTSPRRSRRPAWRSSGRTSRRSTSPRSGRASPRSSTGSGSPSPRAAWPTASRRR